MTQTGNTETQTDAQTITKQRVRAEYMKRHTDGRQHLNQAVHTEHTSTGIRLTHRHHNDEYSSRNDVTEHHIDTIDGDFPVSCDCETFKKLAAGEKCSHMEYLTL